MVSSRSNFVHCTKPNLVRVEVDESHFQSSRESGLMTGWLLELAGGRAAGDGKGHGEASVKKRGKLGEF